MYTPSIIERIGKNSKVYDIPTKMLEDRIVFLNEEIDSDVANSIIMQLLWLASDNPDEPIDLYIKSPGGSVYDGRAIFDCIKILEQRGIKVNTVGIGMCASMGAYLLSAGTGIRKATKNCRIMVHSVSSGNGYNTYHDQKVNFKETEFLQKSLLNDIVSFSKGKIDLKTLEEKSERDWYMEAEEAIKYGLIDEII